MGIVKDSACPFNTIGGIFNDDASICMVWRVIFTKGWVTLIKLPHLSAVFEDAFLMLEARGFNMPVPWFRMAT